MYAATRTSTAAGLVEGASRGENADHRWVRRVDAAEEE
jgi:hypothetical protein